MNFIKEKLKGLGVEGCGEGMVRLGFDGLRRRNGACS